MQLRAREPRRAFLPLWCPEIKHGKQKVNQSCCRCCALLLWAHQVTLLAARVDEAAASAEESADKVNAIGHQAKALSGQVEGLQRETTTDIPALADKVRHTKPSCAWARNGFVTTSLLGSGQEYYCAWSGGAPE